MLCCEVSLQGNNTTKVNCAVSVKENIILQHGRSKASTVTVSEGQLNGNVLINIKHKGAILQLDRMLERAQGRFTRMIGLAYGELLET